jgi:hypothetical protein
MLEEEVRYNGSDGRLYLYDFGSIMRVVGGASDSPTCFAFVLGSDDSIMRYFEGFSDIFPFEQKTVASVRLTSHGSTDVLSHDGDADGSLDDPRLKGAWRVKAPRENEMIEALALLSEDARLYVDAYWGSKTERLQVTVLRVNGEIVENSVEFT